MNGEGEKCPACLKPLDGELDRRVEYRGSDYCSDTCADAAARWDYEDETYDRAKDAAAEWYGEREERRAAGGAR